MKGRSFRLTALFSVSIFLVIVLTMLVAFGIAAILVRFDIIQRSRNPEVLLLALAAVSISFGAVMARFGTKRMVAPIVEISEATKEVAKGNFDVKLDVKTHAREVNTMAKNFILMTQELASTETFHTDFINSVSHEFKTPLSAIEGYATLLQNKTLSEEKREVYIGKIILNTKRLSTLTGNILQLSRLENQEITTAKRMFSLDEQIREDILLLEEKWAEKDIDMDVDLEAIEYYGNSDLLSQVWQNLIGNAVKYVKAGGNIRVILKREADQAKVYISDNGIGMDDETKKRMFEKFFQGDTSHSSEGNGLGLALAKRIVDLHAGTIAVSSKKGKGTTFVVSLPIGK